MAEHGVDDRSAISAINRIRPRLTKMNPRLTLWDWHAETEMYPKLLSLARPWAGATPVNRYPLEGPVNGATNQAGRFSTIGDQVN